MLELDGLTKRYGDVVALDGATFSVPTGSITGFVGRNGAGKSTTMRSIFGLVALDGGTVSWHGRPVTSDDLPRFGYMPEQRGLYRKMKICEQVAYFVRLKGWNKADADAAATQWLTRLGLDERLDDKLETLSHGNQQRVQLAAAVAHDPDLLVLDEPFNGLDPSAVAMLNRQMRELADAGKAILFSSHQLDLVEEVCDRLVFIDGGKIKGHGTLHELRHGSGRLECTASFVSAPDWARLEELGAVMVGPLTARVDNVAGLSAHRLAEQIGAAGELTSFRYEPPSLATIFEEVTS